MSESEAGLTSVGEQKPFVPNMRLTFSPEGTAVYRPVPSTASPTLTSFQSPASAAEGSAAAAGGPAVVSPRPVGRRGTKTGSENGAGSESMKRKRGRPRKYGPDGSMALAIIPSPPSVAVSQSSGGGGQGSSSPPPPPAAAPPPPPPPAATPAATAPTPTPRPASAGGKARGRPPGSGSGKKLQVEVLGSIGLGFMPYIITVKAGEDVSSKIMLFSQHSSRAIVILSAVGSISNVTLRQQATSGGTVTYEGCFEILSLTGSFLLAENGNQRSRTGGLSVSLSGSDGSVLGGGVGGLLTAASPVQVVVACFMADNFKDVMSSYPVEPLSAPSRFAPGGEPTDPSSPPSGPGSPPNQSTTTTNNNSQDMSGTPWK